MDRDWTEKEENLVASSGDVNMEKDDRDKLDNKKTYVKVWKNLVGIQTYNNYGKREVKTYRN